MEGVTPERLRSRYAELLSREDFLNFDRLRRGSPWEGVDCWVWPGVVTRSEWEQVRDFFEELTPRVLAVGLDILDRKEEHRWLPDEPYLLQAISDDPALYSPQVLWRFDFVWDRQGGRIDVLEVQAGDPSGLGWVDARASDYEEVAAWRALSQEFSLHYPSLSKPLCEAFQDLSQKGRPRVLFLAAPESTVKGDIEELASQCARHEVDGSVCSPAALSDEVLQLQDVVYHDTYEELYFPPHQPKGELLARYARQGRVALVNPMRSNLWDSKALFSLLDGVLPTRRLSDCSLEELRAEQDRWVLKPSFHYGGFGIVLGPECEAGQWRAALDEAFQQPQGWVVQRYASPTVELFPFATDDSILWEPRFATWSAWVMQGKVAGLYLRVSTQTVTNVHQGGALMPVFVLGYGSAPNASPKV